MISVISINKVTGSTAISFLFLLSRCKITKKLRFFFNFVTTKFVQAERNESALSIAEAQPNLSKCKTPTVTL